MIDFVHNRCEAEQRDVLLTMHYLLKHPRRRGMGWFSRRYLCKATRRGPNALLRNVRQLVDMGELCRVSAPGRGKGLGRTLYWLPGKVSRWRVLKELEAEAMPLSAVRAAERFFSSQEKGIPEYRRRPPRDKSLGGLPKKDARAARSNGFESRALSPPAPSGPPRPAPSDHIGHPAHRRPSDGSPRWGLEPLSATLQRLSITDNPATHPAGCGCGAHEKPALIDG